MEVLLVFKIDLFFGKESKIAKRDKVDGGEVMEKWYESLKRKLRTSFHTKWNIRRKSCAGRRQNGTHSISYERQIGYEIAEWEGYRQTGQG
jgi:hypothetical protein